MAIIMVATGCSALRHVPEGEKLVDKVTINIEPGSDVKPGELSRYLRQSENHKVFGFLKLKLGAYSLSGRDSTKWYNRWLQRVGQAPVVYDQMLTDASVRQLRLAMVNRGYMDAVVTADTVTFAKGRKVKVNYHVNPGEPHRISTVTSQFPNEDIETIILTDSIELLPKAGQLLNRSSLDDIRTNIASTLQNSGYYGLTKECVTFTADTAANSTLIDLTMKVGDFSRIAGADSLRLLSRYRIGKVYFVTDYKPGMNMSEIAKLAVDTIAYRGIDVIYGDDEYIRPSTLEGKCYLIPGQLYSSANVDRTYESLIRLEILKSININLVEAGESDGERLLNAYILMQRNKKQSITLDLEGTNSEGDLGIGAAINYQHRNMGHRSVLFSAKARAHYESISGNIEGFINNRYSEYAVSAGLTFPQFLAPFLSRSFKQRIKASSELSMSFNYQERPEYTRVMTGVGWKYKWNNRLNTSRRNLDLLDIQYVYLPKSTSDFIDQIAPDNPLLRYSYEDHLIMRIGYGYYRTNRRQPSTNTRQTIYMPLTYVFRGSVETAGNVLYGISKLAGQQRDDGVYRVLGVPYSQYAKIEADYSLTRRFNPRHSLAFHVAGGVAYPYGNSRVVPFEKRFYAGGANGVRGWSARTLGPGSFDSKNSVTSFINQCGDISLLLSAEYRAKLFWVLEGALFIDAGNIWTIHSYENQPGGLFKIKDFWKEMAWSYGLGIRLDFTYFLFRLDLGMKAYNPATDQIRWPLTHPNWHRDATIHFSVGYPF